MAVPSTERVDRYPSSVALHRRRVRATVEAAAISELARRALRSDGFVVVHRNPRTLSVDELSIEISDIAPGLLLGVVGEVHELDGIVIDIGESHVGAIAVDEPEDRGVVWIPGDMHAIWKRFRDSLLRLAAAGYPGCVGCAGPAAEVPWDEEASRRRFR